MHDSTFTCSLVCRFIHYTKPFRYSLLSTPINKLMSKHFLNLLLASSLFFFIGCDELCEGRVCDGRTEFVEFRLMRNQVNALFGPDAFLDQDSIHTYLAYSPGVTTPIEFIQEDQSISLFITEGAPVVLEINNTMRDTISMITALFGWDDCCQFYRPDTIFLNDSVICTGFCFAPIDLEI